METVTIEPYWLGEIFARRPISIPGSVDVGEFFGQSPLPFVFEDPGYASMYPNDKDRGFHWMAVFLSHPNESTALDAFLYWKEHWREYTDSEVRMNYRTVLFICAATHLLSDNPAIVAEAAEFIWRGYSEHNFGKLFRVPLSDLGEEAGYQAAQRLAQYCPQAERAFFDGLCREHFNRSAF